MSVRVIAGEKRGAVLRTPLGVATRPTLGRVRASLFMILQHELPAAHVLDLFAGSGALGLEALSRGARFALFVESARPALEALRVNLEKLGYAPRSRTAAREALEFLRAGNAGAPPYGLVLADPPYGTPLAAQALELLVQPRLGWLAAGATVAVQVGRRDALPPQAGAWACVREAGYGETRVAFYRPAEQAEHTEDATDAAPR